jgi:hypothetical protein
MDSGISLKRKALLRPNGSNPSLSVMRIPAGILRCLFSEVPWCPRSQQRDLWHPASCHGQPFDTPALEQVPEGLVVDGVVELDFAAFDDGAEQARAAIGGGSFQFGIAALDVGAQNFCDPA